MQTFAPPGGPYGDLVEHTPLADAPDWIERIEGRRASACLLAPYFVSLFGDRRVSLFIKDRDAPDHAHNKARALGRALHPPFSWHLVRSLEIKSL